jgi:pimeloyl-ACP methyl ester carboxylesterase
MLLGAIGCVWGALCLTFWQGSWQLLYHPSSTVAKTPASVGIAFEEIGLATNEAGVPQLKGWWLPAGMGGRYTAIYLHDANGNLGDTVDELAQLHATGLTVLAIDYRGYGQSQFVRPSEMRWREDADAAIQYLTATRHISSGSIVLAGDGLGADLALEEGAAHPDLAGVILDQAIQDPVSVILRDPRAQMVPAHALVHDQWDMNAAAARLLIPSLWFEQMPGKSMTAGEQNPTSYDVVASRKMMVWLPRSGELQKDQAEALSRWLDGLVNKQ